MKIRELTKEQLKAEGNKKGKQLKEWNDIFDILSLGRRHELSELEVHSILSNRYKVEESKLSEQDIHSNGKEVVDDDIRGILISCSSSAYEKSGYIIVDELQVEPTVKAIKDLLTPSAQTEERVKLEPNELTEKLTDILGSFHNKLSKAETKEQAAEEFAQTIVYIKTEFSWFFSNQSLSPTPKEAQTEEKFKEELKSRIINMEDNSGVPGCTYGDTDYDSISVVYGYNQALGNVISMIESLPTPKDQKGAEEWCKENLPDDFGLTPEYWEIFYNAMEQYATHSLWTDEDTRAYIKTLEERVIELKSLPTDEEIEEVIKKRKGSHWYYNDDEEQGFKDCFKWLKDYINKQ